MNTFILNLSFRMNRVEKQLLTVNSVNPSCSSAPFIFSDFSVSYSKITNLNFACTKEIQ